MIFLANHLWQSTLFAACALALTWLLRHHRAQVRYWVWLVAALKFLIPFSLLFSLGSRFEGRIASPTTAPALVRQASAPLTLVETLPIPDTPTGSAIPRVLAVLWAGGALSILAHWLVRWRRIHRALSQAAPSALPAPIPVFETPASIEPGVFGLLRPVLLLPSGIAGRLDPAQLQAIIAHEMAHVRRRDNLTAALYMLVQAVFWFHPLVWWIGARLVAERESACDEEVIGQGNAAQDYARGIVNVCRFYVESPLPCAAGVTGADLRRRIASILAPERRHNLRTSGRLALAGAAAAALAVPILAGLAQHPPDTLKFEVASIRESKADNPNSRIGPGPGGGFQATNVTLAQLITFAYGIREFQLIDAPGWVASTRYDVQATSDKPDAPPKPDKITISELETRMGRMRERMRNLLAERCALVIRRESKELPVYALTVLRSGIKLKKVEEGGRPPNMRTGRGIVTGQAVSMMVMANALSGLLSRRVIDETGFAGVYDFEMHFTPDPAPGADGPVDASGPSLFTALQEQLGLKLESRRAPVEVIVVERVQRPTEN